MKKLIVLLLVSIMVIAFVAACGEGGGGGSGNTVFKPQTLTLYQGGTLVTTTSQFSETPIGQKIKEITGITIEMEYLGGAIDTERTALIIAGGDYPDIIMPSHRMADFRDAGVIIPINDLYDANCPTIKGNWGDYINRIKDPDTGVLWGLSASFFDTGDLARPGSGFYMKYDAIAMNGGKVPTSLDEYFDVIRKYVAENPTTADGASTIGFGGPAEDWRWVFSVHGARKPMGWHNTGRFLHDPDNNYEGKAANTYEWNLDYFLRLRGLREEGLLDPEFFSQSHEEYVAKVATGRIVGMYDESWQLGDAFSLIRAEGRSNDLPVPFAIYHPNRMTNMNCAFAGISAMATTTDVCISSQAKDPALILQFFDYLARDDMQELLWWGIEDEHFQKDSSGRRYLTEDQYNERANNVLFGNDSGIGHGGFATLVPTRLFRDVEWPDGSGVTDPMRDRQVRAPILYDDTEKTVLNALGWNTFWDGMGEVYVSPYGRGWDIGPSEEQEDLVDMLSYLNERGGWGEFGQIYFQHMIMAGSDAEAREIWNTMQQWLVDNGVHELEAEFTRRVRDRINTWN